VSVRRVERIQTGPGLANAVAPGRPRSLAVQSPSSEFESYVAAMCGLTLMLVLVVGVAGYAGISRAFRAAAGASSLAQLAPDELPPMRGNPAHISNQSGLHRPATE
jgi:hypothetical protein